MMRGLLYLALIMGQQQGQGGQVPPLCFHVAGVPANSNLVRLKQLAKERNLHWGVEKKRNPISATAAYLVWASPNKDYGLFIEEGGKGWTTGYGETPDDAACDVVGWLNEHTEMYRKAHHGPAGWPVPASHPERKGAQKNLCTKSHTCTITIPAAKGHCAGAECCKRIECGSKENK